MKNTKQDAFLVKREKRYAKQRETRGWDDSETFSLDLTIAKFALPRLKRFKKVTCGCPGFLCSGDSHTNDIKAGMKKWYEILDKIIYAMEIISDDKKWYAPETDDKKVNEGVKLFGEYFRCLWW